MAKFYSSLEPKLRDFIERQHVFFTATAAEGSRINLSPKGLDALRVLGPNSVAYLDWTGSGNETAAHVRADGRLTIMMCAFEGPPNILRLYGRGRILPRGSDEYRRIIDGRLRGQGAAGGTADRGARHRVGADFLRLRRAGACLQGRAAVALELGRKGSRPCSLPREAQHGQHRRAADRPSRNLRRAGSRFAVAHRVVVPMHRCVAGRRGCRRQCRATVRP